MNQSNVTKAYKYISYSQGSARFGHAIETIAKQGDQEILKSLKEKSEAKRKLNFI